MAYRRDAWVEIDLAAVAANVRVLKARTAPGTLFMAVVKADGYGHGAVPVAQTALNAGADWLGVATVEEALELRESGVSAPVLLLAEPPASSAPLLVEYGLTPTLDTREFAHALSAAAVSAGRTADFHLKVDTGMNRIGVRAEEAADFAVSLQGIPGLRMGGVFTHFATADVPGDWEFERQLERLSGAIEELRTERVDAGIVHAANSAATILRPEAHLDMVRCGIAIYGLHPANSTYGEVDLVPAMAVRARVSFVKRIGLGEGVSYGLTWRAAAPTTVATLPLGYADGVHRVLSNSMRVLIREASCPQVGRVCMDQLVVEVPDRCDVRVGDEAVIVGSQGRESILMDEVAELAGTINYEMACSFSRRMRREYL